VGRVSRHPANLLAAPGTFPLSGRFPTTHWSVVLAAKDDRESGAGAALEDLCSAYWPPVYAFIRRQGVDAEAARDLTQGYFARLLEKRYLDDVHPDRGRFRSFLLVSTKHFLANEWDRSRALKRGGARPPLSIDDEEIEQRLREDLADRRDPEQLFERRWALTLLDRALRRLGDEATDERSRARFAALRGFLTGGEDAACYSEVALALGIGEGAVKTAVYRLRRRFGELLREEVAQTVADEGQVDDELRHLLRAVAS
jgi:RNA polymerase sigma factor (sigma-70 family)